MTDSAVSFTCNGAACPVRADHPHLLAALREELDVTSPKDGCSPSGQCGCCTVLVDGKAVVSCQLPLAKVAGKSIVTLEGVDEDERRRYADAFAACGGLQCGFCIPGHRRAGQGPDRQEGRGPHPRRHGPPPRRPPLPLHRLREDPRRHRGGGRRASRWPSRAPGGVGSRGAKYEARELALGDRDYIDDLRVPGMLHAALHLTEHARADVARHRHRRAPRRAPGVVAVFTAADVPGELRVGIIHKDWPVMIPVGGRTSLPRRRAGRRRGRDPPAGPGGGRARRGRLRGAARRSPTPWRRSTIPRSRCGAPTRNVLSRRAYARGDVDAALAGERPRRARDVPDAAHRARLPRAGVDAGRARRRRRPGCTSTPAARACGTTATRSPRCSASTDDRITVELVSNGGAFGGKEDMANQAQTALAAWLLQRPVKCTLSREECLLMHPKRHPIRMEYEAGCDADGTLTALRVRAVGDSGAVRQRRA